MTMGDDDLNELARGIPWGIEHRRQLEQTLGQVPAELCDMTIRYPTADEYVSPPQPLTLSDIGEQLRSPMVTVDPDAAEALRVRLLNGFRGVPPLAIPPLAIPPFPPITPAELEQTRERIRARLFAASDPFVDDDTRAAILAGEIDPAVPGLRSFFESIGRAFQRTAAELNRFMTAIAEQVAPVLRRLAELAKTADVEGYRRREERRQRRRNPSPASLMHRAYRPRRRGRW